MGCRHPNLDAAAGPTQSLLLPALKWPSGSSACVLQFPPHSLVCSLPQGVESGRLNKQAPLLQVPERGQGNILLQQAGSSKSLEAWQQVQDAASLSTPSCHVSAEDNWDELTPWLGGQIRSKHLFLALCSGIYTSSPENEGT